MAPNETETKSESESYYVIHLTLRSTNFNFATKKHEPTTYTCYFKADRYSTYGGRLQTDNHPSDSRKWKTSEGAEKALEKLIEKRTIKTEQNPVVCKYTKTITRTESLESIPVVEAAR